MKHIKLFEEYAPGPGSPSPSYLNKPSLSDYLKLPEGLTDDDLMGKSDLLGKALSKVKSVSDATAESTIGPFVKLAEMTWKEVSKKFTGPGSGVIGVEKCLSGLTSEQDLVYIYSILKALSGKSMTTKQPAVKRFMELYKQKTGRDLFSDINKVGIKTFSKEGKDLRLEIMDFLKKEGLGKKTLPMGASYKLPQRD